ncbi:MAG: hypothetical protein APF76_17530 [Desulfitibacter sp. BRH_c19]|nr:MAG: hypothetical protein APF76_17530 [Desulfitibacter sp. BRH_c19]
MTKIKLMYDVVKVLRVKEIFKGTLKVEVRKDRVKVFSLDKEFEKNTITGQVKAMINTEVDYEGNKVKHQSSTEFNMEGCKVKHHGFIKHMHGNRKHSDMKCCGVKDRLSKMAFMLSVLNNMTVIEQEDKGVELAININEIPEDLKNAIKEKMNYKANHKMHHEMNQHQKGHHHCMKDFCLSEDANADIKIRINKNSEIENITLSVSGNQKNKINASDELNGSNKLNQTNNETHAIDLEAELNLLW